MKKKTLLIPGADALKMGKSHPSHLLSVFACYKTLSSHFLYMSLVLGKRQGTKRSSVLSPLSSHSGFPLLQCKR